MSRSRRPLEPNYGPPMSSTLLPTPALKRSRFGAAASSSHSAVSRFSEIDYAAARNATDPRRSRVPVPVPRAVAETKVCHFAKGDTHGAFAVVLSQMYGPPVDFELPFGSSTIESQPFDGRIKLEPIIKFMPQAIHSSKKTVRVFECAPLSASDEAAYRAFEEWFGGSQRSAVIDREFEMGVLFYLMPAKVADKSVDLTREKSKRKKRGKKAKVDLISAKYEAEMEAADYLKYLPNGSFTLARYLGISAPKRMWLVCVTDDSKVRLYLSKKQKSSKTEDEEFEPLLSDEDSDDEKDKKGSALIQALHELYQAIDAKDSG